MCLTKTHWLPKISRKPIQVYKTFRLEGGNLVTPFQGQLCNTGDAINTKHGWLECIFKNKIGAESVHAYRDKKKKCGKFYR